MKIKDLKEIIAEMDDNEDVCVSVDTHDFWNNVGAHSVISLLRLPVAHSTYTNSDIIVYNRDKIKTPDAAELAEMKEQGIEVNPLGYYGGEPVKEKLIFTY